jgi:hypothetical protein
MVASISKAQAAQMWAIVCHTAGLPAVDLATVTDAWKKTVLGAGATRLTLESAPEPGYLLVGVVLPASSPDRPPMLMGSAPIRFETLIGEVLRLWLPSFEGRPDAMISQLTRIASEVVRPARPRRTP